VREEKGDKDSRKNGGGGKKEEGERRERREIEIAVFPHFRHNRLLSAKH